MLTSRRRLSSNSSRRRPPRRLRAVHRQVGLTQHPLGIGVWRVARPTRRRSRASSLRSCSRRNGRSSASSTRPARAIASASFSMSSARITNSSPPRRATVSLSRISSASRSDDADQQAIAHVVAEVVVDRLELVEVDEQQRHHAASCGEGARAPGAHGPSAAAGWGAWSAGRAGPGARATTGRSRP